MSEGNFTNWLSHFARFVSACLAHFYFLKEFRTQGFAPIRTGYLLALPKLMKANTWLQDRLEMRDTFKFHFTSPTKKKQNYANFLAENLTN